MAKETFLIFSCDEWKSSVSMSYEVSVRSISALKRYLKSNGYLKKLEKHYGACFNEVCQGYSMRGLVDFVNKANICLHIELEEIFK